MENCPKCKEKLNIDEKSSGRCFSCGATFDSSIPKDSNSYSIPDTMGKTLDNAVAKVIRIIGIVIIVLGTVGSLIIASDNQSLLIFLTAEFACVVSGMFFIGIAEIIRLLDGIKDKL